MSKPISKPVKVRIRVSERIVYECEIEMPRSQYQKLDKALIANLRGIENTIADNYIDRRNGFSDANDIEVEVFEIVKARLK